MALSLRLLLCVVSIFQFVINLSVSAPAVSNPQSHPMTLNNIPHWDEAPSSLSDYPLHNNHTTINPWTYLDRLGLYKILLNVTSTDPTLGRANNTANILWGLPMQLGWQFKTGRLHDFTNETKCGATNHAPRRELNDGSNAWNCISPMSWWASMNYYLAVVPFLGAAKAGFFSHWPHEISMSASPIHSEEYCTSVAECSSHHAVIMENWADFFSALRFRSWSQHVRCQGQASFGEDSTLPPTLNPREQNIITKLWIAHTGSIETALPLFDASRLPFMSEPEQSFGLSWANLIGYIAAANFVTDLNTTAEFQMKYLPKRFLLPGDRPPSIPDFTWDVNMALDVLEKAYYVDQKTGRISVTFSSSKPSLLTVCVCNNAWDTRRKY